MPLTDDDGAFKGRENWQWLDDKKWVWLTNYPTDQPDRVLQIEEKYGSSNVEVRQPAFAFNRDQLGPHYSAIFVTRKKYDELRNNGEGVLPL